MKTIRTKSNYVQLALFFVKSSPWMVVLSIVSGSIAGASGAALMTLINGRLANPTDSSAGTLVAFVAVALFAMLSTILSGALSNRLAQRTNFDLRMKMCRSILDASLRRIEQAGDHRVLTTLTHDVSSIVTAFLRVPFLFTNIAIIVGCLLYLGSMSLILLAALVTFVIFSVVSYVLPQRRANRYMRLAREEQGTLLGHFRALSKGAKELKLHNRRRNAFFSEIVQPTAETLQRYNLRGGNIYVLLNGWSQILYFAAIGLILYALPMLVGGINRETMTGFALLVLYMSGPVQVIVNSVPIFINADISLRKIEEFGLSLSSSAKETTPSLAAEVSCSWKKLELLKVTHAYYREHEGDNFTLGPLDLTLSPGELVFLIGGNGSGKTTFAKLLSGLYIPDTGEIRVDGHPVTDENREIYRQLFSVVFTEFHIFEQFLGLNGPDLDKKAQSYLIGLQLEHKVQVKDGKLSTTDLSYGQRKRLALLTAYLEDRPLYIFDEWAADQDPQFKEVFYHQILPDLKARGKTVLVISHDDRFYQFADRIIKLDYGKLVDNKLLVPIPQLAAEGAYVDPAFLRTRMPVSIGRTDGSNLSLTAPLSFSAFDQAQVKNGIPLLPLLSFADFELAQGQIEMPIPGRLEVTAPRPYKWLLSCLFIACAIFASIYLQRPPPALSASAPIDQFSSGRAMQHLRTIASEPRPTGSLRNTEVRHYLVNALTEAGLAPQVQEQVVISQTKRATVAVKVHNVVARLGGIDPQSKSVMLVAHYDSVPNGPGTSDDGAGVVTLLETLRALKTGPRLQHDVIFLFTDGEELGLMGAKAFVQGHPWAKDVGLVLNFEARGNGGPVFMFETSDNNGSLIKEFGKAAPHPFASSLMYTIYKLMPNDTDLTVFRKAGIPGFNFAFVNGVNRYHTQRDSLAEIDERSIQHSGSYALALTKHFANTSAAPIRAQNLIYFDLFGLTLVTYSQSWVIPMLLSLVLLWGLIVFVGLRRKQLTLGGLALGLAAFTSSIIGSAGAATLLWWGLSSLRGDINARTNGWLFFISFAALAIAIFSGLYFLFNRRALLANLIIGTLAGWLLLSAVISLYWPGMSYVFIWSLMFSLAASAVFYFVPRINPCSFASLAILGLCSLPGLLMLGGVTYQIFLGIGLVMPGVLVLLEVLVLALLAPFLRYLPVRYRWTLPAAAVLLCVSFFAIGYLKPAHGRDNPKSDSLTYDLNLDTGEAFWVSGDSRPDEWTSQFFTPEVLAKSKAAQASQPPSSKPKALTAPAMVMPLDTPRVSVVSDQLEGDVRVVKMRVSPAWNTRMLNMTVDANMAVLSSAVDGQDLDNPQPEIGASPPRWALNYYAPAEGFELMLRTKAATSLKLQLVSTTDGFPQIPGLKLTPRPDNLIPSSMSDVTRIVKTFDLGVAGSQQK
jgi:putative ATP-binding cassette transporter